MEQDLAGTAREIMTPEELAGYLGIGRTNTYRLITSGEVPSLKIGKLRRVRRVDVDRWLAERVKNANG